MLGLSALPDFGWGEGDDEMMGGAASDPLSIRLNNPGAIRRNNIQWAGMAPEQDSPFVRFATPEDGIRAMGQLLDTYGRKHGLTTVAGIINRWAPPSENNTGGYVKRVADTMGVDPTQPLNLSDPAVKSALVEAMSTVEAGRKHYTRDQIASALTGQPGAKPMPYDVSSRLPTQEQIDRMAPMAASPEMQEATARDWQPEVRSGAGLSALPSGPQQQPQGLSALSPYLQLARQISPSRESNWGDALINAGAAMMQSTRPDFLGGLGAGLQAGNNTLSQGREQMRGDGLKQFSLAMDLAKFDQKDNKPIPLAEGGMLVTPDGRTVAANPKAPTEKAPIFKEMVDPKTGQRVWGVWNGAMLVSTGTPIGEAPPTGFTRGPDGKLVVEPGYLDAQRQIREAGRPTTNIDLKGETKEKEAVGKALGEMYADKVSLGAKGQQMFDTVTRAEQLMDGLSTGALAPAALSAQKYLSALGIPLEVFGNAAQLGQGEAAMAVANQMALQLRSTGEGAGMPGAMSDKDREFLVSMAPGLGQTPEGRRMIIDSFKRLAQRQIEESRLAEQWYEDKGTMKGFNSFMRDYAQKNPVFAGMQMPAVPAGGAAPQRQTAPGLPPSDADIRRQNAPPGSPNGGIIPGPKRFDLGGAKAAPQPPQTAPAEAKPINQMSARELADLVRANPNDPDVLKQIDDRIKALGY